MGEKTNDQDVVALHSVHKTFGDLNSGVTALDDVSIGFQRGTFSAIMGPSGSGKSTLLNCAAGLDNPTSGSVLLNGTELTNWRHRSSSKHGLE